MELFWLTDRQWARLSPLLPQDTRGVPRVDDRRVISGIVHVLKSGCRWADAPPVYGPRKTLYNRFPLFDASGRDGACGPIPRTRRTPVWMQPEEIFPVPTIRPGWRPS